MMKGVSKYLKIYFAVMLFITPLMDYAQTQKQVDSIIVAKSNDIYEKPDEVIKAGLAIYKNTDYKITSRVRGLMLVSDAYSSKRDYQNALKYFLMANELSKESNDKKLRISILNKTAVKYQQLKVYDKAIQNLDEAQKLIDAYPEKDSIRLSGAMNLIVRGFIYKEQLNCDIAIGYFDKGIKECLRINNTSGQSSLSIATYNKGNCYMMLNNNEKAKQSFQEAIKYADNIHANTLKAFALKGLAQVYTEEAKYELSNQALREAEAISRGVGDIVLNKAIYNGLSNNYFSLNDWESYQLYYNKYIEAQLALTLSERKSVSDSIDESSHSQNEKLAGVKSGYYYRISIIVLLILAVLTALFRYHIKAKKSLNLLNEAVEKAKKERGVRLS